MPSARASAEGDLAFSKLKRCFPRADRTVEGIPTLLMDRGELLEETMSRERVDEQDILEAARRKHGLERMAQVEYAILERDGTISIVPWKDAPGPAGGPLREG